MQDSAVVEKIEAGVDWLTLTSLNQATGASWAAVFQKYADPSRKPGSWLGFEGERDNEGVFFGQRPSDARYVLILPGLAAREHWQKATPCKCKVTRVDLCVDLWLAEPTAHIAVQADKLQGRGFITPCRVTYIHSISGGPDKRNTGDTLYLGSRQSHQYGRYYDKGAQMRLCEAGRWLRQEIEFKQDAARQVVSAMQGIAPEDLGGWIRSAVYDWFSARGVDCLWSPEDNHERFHVRSYARTKTVERKIMWLHSQVRPTIEYLVAEGAEDRLTWALGLEGWIDAAKLD